MILNRLLANRKIVGWPVKFEVWMEDGQSGGSTFETLEMISDAVTFFGKTRPSVAGVLPATMSLSSCS